MKKFCYTARAKSCEEGQVLIIGLILLLILTIGGVAIMSGSVQDERQASNSRGQTDAFMAAEAGMYSARDALDYANWFDFTCTAGTDLNGFTNKSYGDHANYTVQILACAPATMRLLSIGQVDNAGSSREVEFVLRHTGIRGGGLAGAINFLGDIADYEGGNSNAFNVDGAGGPAITTSSDANRSEVYDNIADEGRLDNYVGGIENVVFPDPWASPDKMKELVDAISSADDPNTDTDNIYVGPDVPDDLGTKDNMKINIITGDTEVDMTGNNRGGGLLIVTGKLTFKGTPKYDGVIIVLGGEVQINGGGTGGGDGTVFIADMNTPADGEWSFGEDGNRYLMNGGGTANYYYDCDQIFKVNQMLSSSARDIWGMDSAADCAGGGGDSHYDPLGRAVIDSWLERVNN